MAKCGALDEKLATPLSGRVLCDVAKCPFHKDRKETLIWGSSNFLYVCPSSGEVSESKKEYFEKLVKQQRNQFSTEPDTEQPHLHLAYSES